jgi:hypothetical protein
MDGRLPTSKRPMLLRMLAGTGQCFTWGRTEVDCLISNSSSAQMDLNHDDVTAATPFGILLHNRFPRMNAITHADLSPTGLLECAKKTEAENRKRPQRPCMASYHRTSCQKGFLADRAVARSLVEAAYGRSGCTATCRRSESSLGVNESNGRSFVGCS